MQLLLPTDASPWGASRLQYEINLCGIDSVGVGGNDVLELVCEPHARHAHPSYYGQ